MNAFAAEAPAAFLTTVGTQVAAQWWGRDSLATGSFVSGAVLYTIGP
jgi:hypothetical protein